MNQREPVCICRPRDEWRAELIVQHLRANGVDAYLANRATVNLWGDGSSPFASLEILVPQDQQEAAAHALADFLETDENAPQGP